MPSSVVKSYAKKSGKSLDEVEKDWASCKKAAEKKFKTQDEHYWAYVNACTKKKLGLEHLATEDSCGCDLGIATESGMTIMELGKRNKASQICLGMETIDFQHDNFGKTIESLIQALYEEIGERHTSFLDPLSLRKDISKSDTVKVLASNIEKRLGLKVKINLETFTPGAIMPFYYNSSHVFIAPEWRKFYEGSLSGLPKDMRDAAFKQRDKKGIVDLKAAKLHGIFSEYEHDLFLDLVGNKEAGMEPAEQAAILLHELGHGFTFYEFSDRLDSVNRVMQTLTEELFSDDKDKDLSYIYSEVTKVTDVTRNDLEDIRKTNRVIAGPRLMTVYARLLGSCMPNAKYDTTAAEQMADNFASRFGYGRELITGLQKLHVNAPETINNAFFANLLGNAGFIINIAVVLGGIMLGSSGAGLAMIYAALFAFEVLVSGENDRPMTYDDLKSRYVRIRQQYVELMKDLDLPSDKLKQALENVEQMDLVIKSTRDFSNMFRIIANFLFTKDKLAKKDIEAQKLIEQLASNELFVKSAQLRALTD